MATHASAVKVKTISFDSREQLNTRSSRVWLFIPNFRFSHRCQMMLQHKYFTPWSTLSSIRIH